MNRLNSEIERREYTMKIIEEFTEKERRDWNDIWLLNAIQVSIRKG